MYELKNYLLSMQSHWMINQPLYDAVQKSMPMIARYTGKLGMERLEETPVSKMAKQVFPSIYRIPLFRRQFCKLMVEEIGHMVQEIPFEPNDSGTSYVRYLRLCYANIYRRSTEICGLWLTRF